MIDTTSKDHSNTITAAQCTTLIVFGMGIMLALFGALWIHDHKPIAPKATPYAEAYSRGYADGAEKGREMAYDELYDNVWESTKLLRKTEIRIWNGGRNKYTVYSIIRLPDSY